MRTRVCEMFGIDVPIFAFSHCRDVVVEVSKAGGFGVFGGGINDNLSNFALRNTIDAQLLWEFQNLGFGNRANVKKREAESQQAILTLFRTQDLVAAEVAQAYAQATRAANRIREEVDQDANIIVGATFDETLEGIIRVSVVATGIDHVAMAAKPPDARIAEITHDRVLVTPAPGEPEIGRAHV